MDARSPRHVHISSVVMDPVTLQLKKKIITEKMMMISIFMIY